MYERSKAYTPEDRVLRWISTMVPRFRMGIPTSFFVRHLKGDLTGFNFANLEAALKRLESEGAIRRDWDTPGEYRVQLTEPGAQRARMLEDRAARARAPTSPPPPAGYAASPPGGPQFVSAQAPPPAAAPPPMVARPVPVTVPPAAPRQFTAPEAAPPPAEASAAEAETAAPVQGSPAAQAPEAAPEQEASPAPSSIPAAQEARSGGAIPSSGAPAAANLPVRILLYCMLYSTGKNEEETTVPSEDLSRYLLNQGFLLADDYLMRLFDGLEKRNLLTCTLRPAGGYDLRLTARGQHLSEGLLSGHVSMRQGRASSQPAPQGEATEETAAPAPAPAAPEGVAPEAGTVAGETETSATPANEDELEDRWSAAEAENAELRRQVETLRRSLEEIAEKHQLDRQTLDEVMHQMEEQDAKIADLESQLARQGGAAAAPTQEPEGAQQG